MPSLNLKKHPSKNPSISLQAMQFELREKIKEFQRTGLFTILANLTQKINRKLALKNAET